ncbi:hypothetical protein B4U80_12464 [Leptotrombidium deliense]|uniref:HAT C-terminal dimerisation domain-containing protein n=1 Tax=Leptotrombidium deliense TaxID=299467 RepID=A0A443RTU7_9ACAR|nr:hypothetical protein B4U80_12464 [Leptotrombidium deliense]
MFDTQIMKSDHSLRNYWNLVSVYASADGEKNLSKIALRLAIIPSSNCAVERSFSIQSYVHSKARNRLLNKTTDKLMYIRINRMIFDKIKDDDVIAEFVDSESDIECISDTEDVSFIDELIPSTTGIVATEVIGNAATSMLEYSQQIEPEDNMLFDS